jgi:hypothetical protein
MVSISSKKHTKTPRSSSLGPTTRSATKTNRGNTTDSDGFTTVIRKGDPSKHQPTLTTDQCKQLSYSSPSTFDNDHTDIPVALGRHDVPPVDNHNMTDLDHNAASVTQWQRFTSDTSTHPVHSSSHQLHSTRPPSQQSSAGLSFSDESNRAHPSIPFHQVSLPNDNVIDVH